MFMRLKSYLAEKKMLLKDFCKEVGCTYSHLSGVDSGKRIPGRRLAKDIEIATGGLVKFEINEKYRSKQSVDN